MKAFKIADVKSFMSKLLASEEFDKFLVFEAVIVTDSTYCIDGRIVKEYFDWDISEEITEELNEWGKVRHICYEIIKGKTLPLNFKVVLQLSKKNEARFLEQTGIKIDSKIKGLYLNIYFDRSELKCVSGMSFETFSLDRTIEKEWDLMVQKFFKKNQISFEEV